MIPISNELKEACSNDSVVYREYIVLDGDEIDIKGELYQTAYKDSNFIGTFNPNYLKFTADNIVRYRNKEFDYYKEIDDMSFKVGHFIVTNIEDSDTNGLVKITAFDNGIKFANPYQTSLNYEGGHVTLYDVLQECCTNCGVNLVNSSITNGDFIVETNQFVSGEQYGDVVCAVCLLSGDFATINSDGDLELIFAKETNEIIEDYVELEDKRDTQPITSVSIGSSDIDGENVVLKDQELIDQYGEHWLIINDNPFAYNEDKRAQLITAIFNKVKGFGYSAFTSKYAFKPYCQLGDRIKFRNRNGDLIDSIILRIETNYDNITLSAPSVTSATVNYEQPLNAIDIANRAQIMVDKQNKTIQSVVTNVDNQNEKISQITQTVDEINSKISDITDITVSGESSYASVSLTEVNESEPIMIKIRPIDENISYLYPHEGLFPSDLTYLKVRTLRFTNTTDNTYQDYELPDDLLYYDEDNYDEFNLGYETQTCTVTKKCKYNADGSVGLLDTPRTTTCEYPYIPLTEGNYTVSLLGYTRGYIYVTMMAKNIYTTQFYTKAETNTIIDQTRINIDLSVNQKLTNYVTTTQMNSSLSLKADTATLGSYYTKTQSDNKYSTKAELTAGLETIEDNVVSYINASADTIRLNGGRLIITTGNFKLDASGNITASGGTIGNLTILNNDGLYCGTGNNMSGMGMYGVSNAFWAGSSYENRGNAPFRVEHDGSLTATKAYISGEINLGNNQYYLRMGNWTRNPEVSGLNVTGGNGINVNNLGFNSNGYTFAFAGGINTPYLHATNDLTIDGDAVFYGNLRTNQIKPGGYLQIATGGRTGYGTTAGSIYLYAGAHITLNASWDHYVYIGNANVGNTRAAVDGSGPSSRCLKKNITEFKNNEYDEALSLLKDIKLYDYEYKYNIHPKENQYGFIIDDLLDNELADKFLYFIDEKAGINKNNYLDYSAAEENPDNMPIINFKRYDEETLIKYLLVVCKALQIKVESLEKE